MVALSILNFKLYFPPRLPLLVFSQYFTSVLRDEQLMLKLCRALPVFRYRSPVVRPHFIVKSAQVDHRFYCKHVAFLHNADGLVFSVVRHVWSRVEELMDPLCGSITSFESEIKRKKRTQMHHDRSRSELPKDRRQWRDFE
jgi:hypothetical protein